MPTGVRGQVTSLARSVELQALALAKRIDALGPDHAVRAAVIELVRAAQAVRFAVQP